jgi:hypothetical protein
MTQELQEQLDNIVRLLLSEDTTSVELGFALVDAKPWTDMYIERETWDETGQYQAVPVGDRFPLLYIYSWLVRGLISDKMMQIVYDVRSRHFNSNTIGQWSIYCNENSTASIEYSNKKRGRACKSTFFINHKNAMGYFSHLSVTCYIYRIKGVHYLSFYRVEGVRGQDLMCSDMKLVKREEDERTEYYGIKALQNLSKLMWHER